MTPLKTITYLVSELCFDEAVAETRLPLQLAAETRLVRFHEYDTEILFTGL